MGSFFQLTKVYVKNLSKNPSCLLVAPHITLVKGDRSEARPSSTNSLGILDPGIVFECLENHSISERRLKIAIKSRCLKKKKTYQIRWANFAAEDKGIISGPVNKGDPKSSFPGKQGWQEP